MSLTEKERLQYERSLFELRTLQRAAEELSRSLDLDEVLGRCVELVMDAAHAKAGVIYLYDAGRQNFRRVAARAISDESAPPILPADRVLAALSGSSVQIDVTPDAPNPIIVSAWHEGLRGVVMLPLRTDELMGFLAVHFRHSPPLEVSTVKTLEAISRQSALAIRNAHDHQVLERRRRLANGLREFSERALACSEIADLHRLILDSAVALTHNDRGLIGRITDGKVRVVAGCGVDADLVGIEAPTSTPYLADALAVREPVVVEDTATLDPTSLFGQISRAKGTRCYMLTMVRHGDRPVGLLFTASGEPCRYEPEEREAMQILATVAGEALERLGALERLAAEKQRLALVLEHLPILVSVIGKNGELIHLNAAGRAFAEEFGAQGPDWRLNVDMVQTLGSDGKIVPRDEYLIMRAFRNERPEPRELTLLSTDGRLKRHVVGVAVPLHDGEGNVDAVVVSFQDVTSLRRLADAKDHFLRIASHELRSPLTSLRATTSLLEMDPTAIENPERRTLLLDRVQRQVDRLTRLVEQLIDSVRLNATEPPIERVPTDLVALCREVIDALPDRARVSLEAEGRPEGRWDPLRLEQVLSNLLSNAARYSAPDAPIVVRVRSDGEHAVIEVIDRGIGVPPDQMDRLFTPFFRASNAPGQSKGGLGLGLHIAHEIVRRHGGSLTVTSKLAEGSTFTVTLPLGG
jgi:signal transduction histidine kinase